LATGDRSGAVAAVEQAATAAPQNAQIQAQAGYTELAAGDPAAATKRFEAALVLEPDRLPVRQDLARAYGLAGEWAEARRAYAEAITATAAQAQGAEDGTAAQALHDLRRENARATREFAFELVNTLCAPGGAVGCGVTSPLIE